MRHRLITFLALLFIVPTLRAEKYLLPYPLKVTAVNTHVVEVQTRIRPVESSQGFGVIVQWKEDEHGPDWIPDRVMTGTLTIQNVGGRAIDLAQLRMGSGIKWEAQLDLQPGQTKTVAIPGSIWLGGPYDSLLGNSSYTSTGAPIEIYLCSVKYDNGEIKEFDSENDDYTLINSKTSVPAYIGVGKVPAPTHDAAQSFVVPTWPDGEYPLKVTAITMHVVECRKEVPEENGWEPGYRMTMAFTIQNNSDYATNSARLRLEPLNTDWVVRLNLHPGQSETVVCPSSILPGGSRAQGAALMYPGSIIAIYVLDVGYANGMICHFSSSTPAPEPGSTLKELGAIGLGTLPTAEKTSSSCSSLTSSK